MRRLALLVIIAALDARPAAAAPPRLRFAFAADLRVSSLHPGAARYFDTLEAYGYEGTSSLLVGGHGAAGWALRDGLELGATLGWLHGWPGSPAGRTISVRVDAVELGVWIRPAWRPARAVELAARLEGGAALASQTLRREEASGLAPFGRLTAEALFELGPGGGLSLEAAYTLTHADLAFEPWLAHPIGGLSFGLGGYFRY